ncbi:MAG: hypothetical protein LBF72_01125 [Holosporales bacterium]|jgi:NADH-quinone oxidoreductase subunit N|nr:hypothetical protein [Holosporales bacterium]
MFSAAEILEPILPECVLLVGAFLLLLHPYIIKQFVHAFSAKTRIENSAIGLVIRSIFARNHRNPYVSASVDSAQIALQTYRGAVENHNRRSHHIHKPALYQTNGRALVYIILLGTIFTLGYEGRSVTMLEPGIKKFFAISEDYDFNKVSLAGAFIIDNFVTIMKMIVLVWSLFFLFVLKPVITNNFEREKYVCWLFVILGYFLAISSNDLILLFLGLEMSSIALALFSALDGNNKTTVSNFFFAHCIGTSLLLFGCTLLFGIFQTTNYQIILSKISNSQVVSDVTSLAKTAWATGTFQSALGIDAFGAITKTKSFTLSLALIFFFLGVSAKMLFLPFHGIFKDAAEKLNWRMFLVLNFLPFFVCLIILIRFFSLFCFEDYKFLFLSSGLFVAISCAFNTRNQNTIKGMLACNSSGAIGVLMACFAVSNINVMLDIVYFLITQALALMIFAGIISSIERSERQFKTINDLSFVNGKLPPSSIFLLVASVLCFVGCPPFPSFISLILLLKVLILEEAYAISAIIITTRIVAVWSGMRMAAQLLSRSAQVLAQGQSACFSSNASRPFARAAHPATVQRNRFVDCKEKTNGDKGSARTATLANSRIYCVGILLAIFTVKITKFSQILMPAEISLRLYHFTNRGGVLANNWSKNPLT